MAFGFQQPNMKGLYTYDERQEVQWTKTMEEAYKVTMSDDIIE